MMMTAFYYYNCQKSSVCSDCLYAN